jgi:hypothetical protein
MSGYVRRARVCIVKRRVTLTLDPAMSHRAKRLAHARQTSVSALVEGFLRSMPLTRGTQRSTFVERWSGKFKLARTTSGDARMRALKARYRLNGS